MAPADRLIAADLQRAGNLETRVRKFFQSPLAVMKAIEKETMRANEKMT